MAECSRFTTARRPYERARAVIVLQPQHPVLAFRNRRWRRLRFTCTLYRFRSFFLHRCRMNMRSGCITFAHLERLRTHVRVPQPFLEACSSGRNSGRAGLQDESVLVRLAKEGVHRLRSISKTETMRSIRTSRTLLCGPQMLGQCPLQLFDALAGDGRDRVKLQLAAFQMRDKLLELLRVGRVNLGGYHDHLLLGQ